MGMNILITGHCGFIGKQVWNFLKLKNYNIYGIDNLSRKSSSFIVDDNSKVLDIRNIHVLGNNTSLNTVFPDIKFDWIIHLAAQVSVVESQLDPRLDFETNALGTFNIVQLAKAHNAKIIYSSTNKVFGNLEHIFTPISDDQPYNPKTNYGVSKCTGAQYVADYEHGWVLHQSCIYGESQLGDENQGWVGWVRQCIKNNFNITCYGDGKQVRDLLHVDDLINLYEQIILGYIPKGSYIVGGGTKNAFSFENVVNMLGGVIFKYDKTRNNDQYYFVSGNENLHQYGWEPKINFGDIIPQL